MGCTSIEFDLFDNEGPDLVIGVVSESPIVVRNSGIVEEEGDNKNWFINSSVQQLAECTKIYDALRQTGDEDNPRAAIGIARNRMQEIDPVCMSTAGSSLWRAVLEDMEALCW